MDLIDNPPPWYWIVAIVFTVWHGIRGFWLYWIDKRLECTKGQRILLYCIHYMILCVVTTAAGFFTLWTAYSLWNLVPAPHNAPVVAFVSFLFLFGLVGITGELPPLIQRGRIPGKV